MGFKWSSPNTKTYNKNWYQKNRDEQLAASKERARFLRKLALERLGNKCIRCNYSDERALCFDHKNGQDLRQDHSAVFYKKIVDGLLDDEIQILCSNCNMIKAKEGKEYTGRGNKNGRA